MLNMWQTQGQWNNRQHPRVYKAFVELWGTHKLWCSIDCADCKPPADLAVPGRGHALNMHCDVEQRMLRGGLAMEPPASDAVNAPWGLRVQGNLYLADTPQNGGGFRCGALTAFSIQRNLVIVLASHHARWRNTKQLPLDCSAKVPQAFQRLD